MEQEKLAEQRKKEKEKEEEQEDLIEKIQEEVQKVDQFSINCLMIFQDNTF